MDVEIHAATSSDGKYIYISPLLTVVLPLFLRLERFGAQLSFFVPLQPILRGEGSFAAFLRKRSGHIFGDGYHTQNGGDAPSSSCWRTRSLPLAAKSLLVSFLSLIDANMNVDSSDEFGFVLVLDGGWLRSRFTCSSGYAARRYLSQASLASSGEISCGESCCEFILGRFCSEPFTSWFVRRSGFVSRMSTTTKTHR